MHIVSHAGRYRLSICFAFFIREMRRECLCVRETCFWLAGLLLSYNLHNLPLCPNQLVELLPLGPRLSANNPSRTEEPCSICLYLCTIRFYVVASRIHSSPHELDKFFFSFPVCVTCHGIFQLELTGLAGWCIAYLMSYAHSELSIQCQTEGMHWFACVSVQLHLRRLSCWAFSGLPGGCFVGIAPNSILEENKDYDLDFLLNLRIYRMRCDKMWSG